MEIKNLKKAAARIKKAIRDKERIILYGDADLDGAGSVIILKESIKNLGGEVAAVYFPDREKDGYGISEKALKGSMKKLAPALLIALDCGISNFKEVKLANSLGFEVIIVDHHQVLDELPEASIVVDPKQKGDRYPFKDLATVGVAYRLALALFGKKLTDSLDRNFLELAALGTIADMMPEVDENKLIIDKGLPFLEKSYRPGLRALLSADLGLDFSSLRQKLSKAISLLNVRDIEGDLPVVYRILTVKSEEEAEELVAKLLKENAVKKQKVEEIIAGVEDQMAEQGDLPVILAGHEEWELILLGVASSIICNKYQKPTFLFKKLKKESQGSVRAPAGIDSVALMKKCREHLLAFGGHAPASGFRAKNSNLEKFRNCLVKNIDIL